MSSGKSYTVYKHKSGMWCAQYWHNGIRRSVYAKTQTAAESKVKEEILRTCKEIDFQSKKLTFAEWLNYWLEICVKPAVKISTYKGYEAAVRIHIIPLVGNVKIANLTADIFEKLFNELFNKGSAGKTVCNIYNILHCCLKAAVKNGVLEHNIIEDVKLPKYEIRKERVLSDNELEKLTAAVCCDKNVVAFGIVVILFTGLHRSELLALKWKNVEFESRLLTVLEKVNRICDDSGSPYKTKNKIVPVMSRKIPLTEDILAKFIRYKENQKSKMLKKGILQTEDTFIIANRNFMMFDPKGFDRIVKRISESCGINNLNTDILRRTFAVRCFSLGMDIVHLSYLLGCKNVNEAIKYLRGGGCNI